eukprot:gene10003-12268_t
MEIKKNQQQLRKEYDKLYEKKLNAISKFEDVDKKILKLYNAVKIDQLKRKQELEETEKQIQYSKQLVMEMEKNFNSSQIYYSNEKVELMSLMTKEKDKALKAEEQLHQIIQATQSVPMSSRPLQSSKINELRESQHKYFHLERQYQELLNSSRGKESHLKDLINQLEQRINMYTKEMEERERERKNKKELDNLIKTLELEELEKQLLKSMDIKPNYILEKEREMEREKEQRELEIKKKIEEEEKEKENKRLAKVEQQKKLEEQRESELKKLIILNESIHKSPDLVIKPILYPLTIQVENEILDCTYSLEQDTIHSLRIKIYELIQQSKFSFALKSMDIKSVDELSLKTSSNSYFSNEPKTFLTPMSSFIRVRPISYFGGSSPNLSPSQSPLYSRPQTTPTQPSLSASQPLLISNRSFSPILSNSPSNRSTPNLNSSFGGSNNDIQLLNLSGSFSSETSGTSPSWKSCAPSRSTVSLGRESPTLQSTQGQCTIRLYITSNIIKTFICHVQTSVGELQDLIFTKYSKIIAISQKDTLDPSSHDEVKTLPPNEMKLNYVLKIRGREIYFLNSSIPLSSFDFINTKSRRQKKIEILLLKKDQVDKSIFSTGYDYLEISKLVTRDIELEEDSSTTIPDQSSLSFNVKKNIRVRIGGLKNFDSEKFQSLDSSIFVSIQFYQCGYKINEELNSPKTPLVSNPSWLNWIEGPSYTQLPLNTVVHFQIKITGKNPGEESIIGWVNFRLWDYKNKINSGYTCLKVWMSSKPNPLGPTHENRESGSPITFSFEVDLVSPSIYFSLPPANSLIDQQQQQQPEELKQMDLSFEELQRLTVIFEKNPLVELNEEERELCWKYRHYCKHIPHSTAKVISSVPWNNPECTQELYQMLQTWTPLEVIDSLELLSSKFLDKEVRKFAVKTLRRMTDSEIIMYLPQIIQAIKHEPNHYSTLAKFLIRRTLLNRQQMGHVLFWQIKAEISCINPDLNPEWIERYLLILESYLRGCGERLTDFSKQYEMYSKIKSVALGIKSIANTKKKEFLTTALSNLKLSNEFQLLINPELKAKGIDIGACKVKESKTMPLFLSFQNYDPLGDNILTIFKAGDDLRQDQLTIQMIEIMDRIWLSEGIDLQTITYKCMATGPAEGMIEVVGESMTIAEIQKLSGGVTAAFSETAISSWLKQVNPSEFEYNNAVENFIRSCAGCCVYSFILGIGDRHNDNIMITKSGHLFHIDFGRFLGNVQTWNGIKRERAPFVFPPSFANIIGDQFKTFEELCCKAYNSIRRRAHVFLNLFLMMISTGMPELNSESDIYYLRDALALDLTPDQANAKFIDMIQDSLKTSATNINFAVHILANPN